MPTVAEKFFESDDGRPSSVPPSARGGSAARLLKAAADGDSDAVVAILDAHKGDVNMIRARGSSALHEAAKGGHIAVVRELVGRSASVDSVNRSGCTALHWAALCKDKRRALDVAVYLLESGASVNASSEKKDTPLHFASYSTPGPFSDGVCRCLLEWRAVVNTQNRGAESPLMNAVINNNVSVVKVLVEYNADIHQKNSLEKTCHDVASDRGCAETLELLEELLGSGTSELRDVTQQLRATMAQMRAVDALSAALRRRSTMASAYESAALALVPELDAGGRAQLASKAVALLRESLAPEAQLSEGESRESLQGALAALLLVSRGGGAQLLSDHGLCALLPAAERQAAERQLGHRELGELKLAALQLLLPGAPELEAESPSSSSSRAGGSPPPDAGGAARCGSPSAARGAGAGGPGGPTLIGRPPLRASTERGPPPGGDCADGVGSARYGPSGRPHRRLRVAAAPAEAPATTPAALR